MSPLKCFIVSLLSVRLVIYGHFLASSRDLQPASTLLENQLYPKSRHFSTPSLPPSWSQPPWTVVESWHSYPNMSPCFHFPKRHPERSFQKFDHVTSLLKIPQLFPSLLRVKSQVPQWTTKLSPTWLLLPLCLYNQSPTHSPLQPQGPLPGSLTRPDKLLRTTVLVAPSSHSSSRCLLAQSNKSILKSHFSRRLTLTTPLIFQSRLF